MDEVPAQKKDYVSIKEGIDGQIPDVPSAPSAAPVNNSTVAPAKQDSANQEFGDYGPLKNEAPAPSSMNPPQQITEAPKQDSNIYGSFDTSAGNIPSSAGSVDIEKLHEVAEAVVSERWDELLSKTGNLPVWKEKVNMNITAIKQEIVRINEKFDNLQNAVLGKVKEYDQGVRNIHSEMKALEKVFGKILEPLVSNIKELDRVVKRLNK